MTEKKEPVLGELSKRNEAERVPDPGERIEIGEWYWLKDKTGEHSIFACVVQVGSNYVKLTSPDEGSWRVHFNHFEEECRRELDPEAVIRKEVTLQEGVVQAKLAEIRKVTARLGLDPKPASTPKEGAPGESRELSVLSGTRDLSRYKKDLIRAQKEELPALFKEVEEAHEELATWMSARAIPARALAERMKDSVGVIEGRVFNISLYAGLTEEVVQVAKGAPAAAGERLRLLQRLNYMDEECLLNYRHGGVDFQDIGAFDKWLAKHENRDRIMPYPRCMVAFRVRRERKERDWGGDVTTLFMNIQLGELDEMTFLYIRNGDRLYRLNTELELDELIFPGRHEFNLSEPMMADVYWGRVEKVIPKREYEDLLREHREGKKKYAKWEEENPKKSHVLNPFHDYSYDDHHLEHGYQPFDKSSVYYDDIKKTIEKRIEYYNRIALILQGLFDRSDVLHPHPPARLWEPEGFSTLVELVYDGSDTLHYGKPPDWPAYRAEKNAALAKGSVTVGQDRYWARKMAERENSRWNSNRNIGEEYRPYGDPGPGYLAVIQEWQRKSRHAIFRWTRKKRTWSFYREFGEAVPAAIRVPETSLFNVSAYVPGEYKQFFRDPRTRRQYLKWAPLLLAAEEYHAGNLKPGPTARDS